MNKELNDLIIREHQISSEIDRFRYWPKLPDGHLTDERRAIIVKSFNEERHKLWDQIFDLCDKMELKEI